jgi:hypothetical protein
VLAPWRSENVRKSHPPRRNRENDRQPAVTGGVSRKWDGVNVTSEVRYDRRRVRSTWPFLGGLGNVLTRALPASTAHRGRGAVAATRARVAIASGAVVLALVAVPTTEASISHAGVVSANPANFTPNVEDDAVVANAAIYAFAQVGDTMFAGGAFRKVTNAARTETYTRYNFMGFSAASPGTIRPIAPQFDGPVWALQASGSSLYVGGGFTQVNGTAHRALVKLDAATGALDPTFNPMIRSGNITEIRLVGGRLIVGGTFPKKLAALNPTTGADTGYISLGITGSVASNAGPTKIYRFAVNPAGDRLVAIGNFTSVASEPRRQAFMARLGASATLSPWHPPALDLPCTATGIPVYLKDVDFSPDGSYFVFASSGNVPRSSDIGKAVCDAGSRFETADETSLAKPTWINYTGGDTLHSVAATGAAVYVQGHQRWMDNPFGKDYAGPGAVSRPGIAALDPVTGKALSWNPTKTRGVGGKEFLATSAGLWVGSDGRRFAGEYRSGIAFCPL